MVDVFEQVEEELRSDRYKRLARTWLPIVGGILAIALSAALGWWGWQSYQTSRADKASVSYEAGVEALQAGNTAAAQAAFVRAADEGNGAYKALALTQQAAIAETAKRDEDAIRLFDEAAKASRDPILADQARWKAALIVMDKGTLEDIQARLTPLTEEGRPLRPYAQHSLALALLQHGKPADARSLLVQLTLGQEAPDGIRQQAQAAIDLIDSGGAANLKAILDAQDRIPAAPAPQPGPQGAPQSGAEPQSPTQAPA